MDRQEELSASPLQPLLFLSQAEVLQDHASLLLLIQGVAGKERPQSVQPLGKEVLRFPLHQRILVRHGVTQLQRVSRHQERQGDEDDKTHAESVLNESPHTTSFV